MFRRKEMKEGLISETTDWRWRWQMACTFSMFVRCLTAVAFLAGLIADTASATPFSYKPAMLTPMPVGNSQPPICRISDTLPVAKTAITIANTTQGKITVVGIADDRSMQALAEIGAGEALRVAIPAGVSALGFLQDSQWVGDGYRITGMLDQAVSVPFADQTAAAGEATEPAQADLALKAMQDHQSGVGSVPVLFTNTTDGPVVVVATDENNSGFPLYEVAAGESIKQRAQPGTKLWFYKSGTDETVGAPYVVEISDGEAVSIPVARAAARSAMQQKQSGEGSVGARFINATDDNVTVIVADDENKGHVLFEVQRGASLDARVLPGAKLFFYGTGTQTLVAPTYEVAGLDGEEITISPLEKAQPQQQVEQNEPQKSKMQKLQEGPGSIPVRFTNSLQETATVVVFANEEVHNFFEIGAGETVSHRVLPQTDLRFINAITMTDIGEPYVTKGVKGEKVNIVPPKPTIDPAVAAMRDKHSGPGSVEIQFENEANAEVAVTVEDDADKAITLFTIPTGQIVTQKALPGSELRFFNTETGEALPPGYEVTTEQPQTAKIRTRPTLEQVRQQQAGPGSVSVTFRNGSDFALEGIIADNVVQMQVRLFQVAPGETSVQQLQPKTRVWFVKAGTEEDVPQSYVIPDTAPDREIMLPYIANELAAAEAGPGSVPVSFTNSSGEVVAIAKSIGKGAEKQLHTLYLINPGQSVTHRLQPKTQIWFVKGDTNESVGRDIPYFVRATPGEAVLLPYNPTDDELLAMNGINIEKMIAELAGDFSQKSPEGPQFCWRDSYGRGAGTVPRSCPAGMSEDTAGLCYPNCKPGYKQFVTMCIRQCPPGYTDDGGLFCYKPAPYERYAFPWKFGDSLNMNDALARCKASSAGRRDGCGIYNSNTMVYTDCRAGYKTAPVLTNLCTPVCPSDMVEFGVSCMKPSYDRGVGQLMSCSSGMQRDAGLCYNGCSNGFTGVGPVCWNQCPAKLPYSCGMGCAADKSACDSAITDQVTAPLIAAGSIALTIVTAGGGSAAANAAKTAGKTGAQIAAKAAAKETARRSLKASVKAALTRMAKVPIVKEVAIDTAIGSTIGVMIYGYSGTSADFGYLKLRDAIKQIVISRMLTKVDDKQIDAVVNTVMEGAEAKAGVDVDFPWTSLDPTGIADTVIAYNYPVCTDVKP